MSYIPRTNVYSSLEKLRYELGYPTDSTVDDEELLLCLETASRQIDAHCGRHFFVEYGARTFTPTASGSVLIDDLVSTGSNVPVIVTDDGNRTYSTTWATTDYDLLPERASYGYPPEPYWKLECTPYGANRFSRYARGVRITGKWGYYEVLRRVRTAAGVAITAAVLTDSATSFTASAAPPVDYLGAGSTILIDAEQMAVVSVSGTTVTVIRGLNGTTAAAHIAASAIDVYTYPVIESCCLLQAADLFRSRNTLGGEQASDEFGAQRSNHAFLLRVEQMLAPFRRLSVG